MKEFIVGEGRLSEKERRTLSILDSIRRNEEISRAEISKITDLNIVTVSNYVGKYIKKKLVFETGLDVSTGGRRPELLKLNCQYGYSIGIDLGAPHLAGNAIITGVMMDMSGKVIIQDTVRKEKESFERLTEKVLDLTEGLITKSGISSPDIKGIGVGIWGVLDRYRGMVRYAVEEEQIVSYQNLLNQLESRFGVPTLIEHDATLAAFGERWGGIGAGSTADNLVFLCADSSCGLIIKGELYYGASKSAGELNLNPPRSGVAADPQNCWATYDFGCCLRSRGIDLGVTQKIKGLLSDSEDNNSLVLESAGGDIDKITFNMVVESAEKGDEISKKVLSGAGEYLGAKVAFLVNLFNPEVIVIGRGIETAGDTFFSALRKSVRRWGYEESVKVAKIFPTSLGGDGVAIGAGALVIKNVFAQHA